MLVSVNDAQTFECALRQERATTCNRGYRAQPEKQKIAARPTPQKLGVNVHYLWRSFLEKAWGPFGEHRFRRGCVVCLGRIVFVVTLHCLKPSALSAKGDHPAIMLRSVSHPSANTRTTWGTTKRIKSHISQKCQ